jgi:hypothetical protein
VAGAAEVALPAAPDDATVAGAVGAGPSVSASGPSVTGDDGAAKASAGGVVGSTVPVDAEDGASSDAIASTDADDAPDVAGVALGVTKAK